MNIKKDNNITTWINSYYPWEHINLNQIFRWTDINWREVSYWHNNSSYNISHKSEFETLTFSFHHHNSYPEIRKYAKWWVIDGANWNWWSSYNNENWDNWWRDTMNNSDNLICAAYR